MELKSGPIVHALLQYDFIVLYPIVPKSLAKYRQAFTQSGAKDDPTDAFLMMDFLGRHGDKLKPVELDLPETRKIQKLVEHRRLLVQEKIRTTNRITSSLKEYYPQVLDWFDEIDTVMFCDFMNKWPNLKKVKKARENALESFYYQHNVRIKAAIDRRIKLIQSSTALTDDPVVIQTNQFFTLILVKMLREIISSIKLIDMEIASQFEQHEDFDLFSALPGAGPVFAPRLLAAMGSNRNRFQSSDELVRQVGVAPVLERSGKKSWVHWRYACSKFVRQTFVEWANHSIKYSYWAKVYYQYHRDKGKSHQSTLRSLAFKWARILYRCWKNREMYNETKYLLVLKEKQSSWLSNQTSNM